MGSPFLQSLLDKCSTAPWHQGIFLSQKMINESFFNMWLVADDSSPIRSFKLETMMGTIDAKLKAPSIIVNVVEAGFTLYMQWNFESGSVKLAKDYTGSEFVTFDVKNWVVAFGSLFEREKIDETNPLYEKYKKEMGVPPSSKFSLASLYLKALESPTYYAEGSNFQGIDWAKQDPIVQTNFAYLRFAWMATMRKQGQTKVAVSLTTDDPSSVNPYAPSFPPTSLDWTSYPWIDPFQPNTPANTYPANALAYLIMTDKVQPPVPPAIPYTGTWVTTDISDPNRDAIFSMSSNQFWEQWFLPQLQVANLAIQMQPTTPYLEWNNKHIGSFYWGPRFEYGTSTAHPNAADSYYKWTKTDTDEVVWQWDADPNLMKAEKDIDSTLNHIWFKQEAWANGTIKFDRGSNRIYVNNQSHYWGQVNVGDGGWKGWLKMEWYIYSKMKFVAQRVDDGGMQLIPDGSPEVTASKPWWDTKWMIMPDDTQAFIERQEAAAVSTFKWLQNRYLTTLVEGFKNQNKLVLPGSGDYLFSDVAFGKKGNLLANLAFNGAAPPGQARPQHPALKGLPARRKAEDFLQPEPGPPPAPMVFNCIPTQMHKTNPAVHIPEMVSVTRAK